MTALQVQASLNGGAWPFDDVERARLAEERCNSVNTVYFPIRVAEKNLSAPAADDPITSAVAMQYEGWPYPAWTRVTVGKATHLPAVIGAIDNESGEMLPIEANMLIAGCGTGRQAAAIALDYPDATITAIDLSQASLDYAQRQCAALGIVNVRFIKLDLHDVAALNQRFHAIHCTGVLHHLPDPERGLKILADVLHPGGVMRIMVYNRHRRLMMNGARAFVISDLLKEPICDDLLRQVRRRFLEQPKNPAAAYVMCSRDFSTLAGTHDLLLHRHEDPFDIQRIENALTHARLRMLSFDMPSPAITARYDAMFPNDPKHRDFESWARFELIDRDACEHHFSFWCRSYTS
jgi:2-polyprenyl-3-methyl-5-hydroxy-6-metoxy-1,4-benzoquinol methylase